MENVKQEPCVFCNIISRAQPRIVYEETDEIIVIKKKDKPRKIDLPVNILIIPKKHIANIKYLNPVDTYDSSIMSKMVFMAQFISRQLTGNGDFWVSLNNGPKAKQTVFHMHMHFKSWEKWPGKIHQMQTQPLTLDTIEVLSNPYKIGGENT